MIEAVGATVKEGAHSATKPSLMVSLTAGRYACEKLKNRISSADAGTLARF